MAELTRRGFLNTSAVGAAVAASGVAATPLLTTSSLRRPDWPLPESMVVHVRDLAKSEVSLMMGTEEIIYRDAQLVDQLLDAIARHGSR